MRLVVLLSTLLLLSLLPMYASNSFDHEDEPEEGGLRGRGKGKRGKRKEGDKKRRSHPQVLAMQKWGQSLEPEKDYNYENWRVMFHSRSINDFFNGYAGRMSKIFAENGAKVNFAMIGACDGTSDNMIRELYLPNKHWRGVFIEPMSPNVRDLLKYLSDHDVSDRSLVIQAAATSVCETPTITVERPLYEEKNASLPHWLRRQIGSVLPKGRTTPRKEWTTEEVRCVTASDILTDWAGSSTVKGNPGKKFNFDSKSAGGRKRRPHVLKIDAEGHDFQVLMSFFVEGTPRSELPLLVGFEAKSIAKNFPAAKERMESLGYVVSPYGQDGFALLKGEYILSEKDEE